MLRSSAHIHLRSQCFLVLLRHALRVDGVVLRHHDTRIFHKFGTNCVLRARRLAEASLEPLPDPKSPSKLDSISAAAPWAMPPNLASLTDEHKAAEKLAMLPPKSESIEELLLV